MLRQSTACSVGVWASLPGLLAGCMVPESKALPPDLAERKTVVVWVANDDDNIRDGVAFDPHAARAFGFDDSLPLLALGYDYELEDLQIPEQLPYVQPRRPLPPSPHRLFRLDPESGAWQPTDEIPPVGKSLAQFDYGRCLEHGRCTHPGLEILELCTPCEPASPLEPVAPPALAECFTPWVEDTRLLAEEGVHGCLWPHLDCPGDGVRPWPYLEGDACAPPLPDCSDQTWPTLPPGSTGVVYVAAMPGLTDPNGDPAQANIVDANEQVQPGGVIALSKGQHNSTNVFIRDDVKVIGPCARTTTITLGDPIGDRVAFFDGENALEGVRVEGRLWIQRGHLAVKNVRIVSPVNGIVSIEDAQLDVDGAHIFAAEDGVSVLGGGSVHLRSAVIENAGSNGLHCDGARMAVEASTVRHSLHGLETMSCTISVERSLFEDLSRGMSLGQGSVGHVSETVIRRGQPTPFPSGLEIVDASVTVRSTNIQDVFGAGIRILSSTITHAQFYPHPISLEDLRIEGVAFAAPDRLDGTALVNLANPPRLSSEPEPEFVVQRVIISGSAGTPLVSNAKARALFEDLVVVDSGAEGNCVSMQSGVGPFMLSRAHLRCGTDTVVYLLHDEALHPTPTTTISDVRAIGGRSGMRLELLEGLFVARVQIEAASGSGILLPMRRSSSYQRQRFQDLALIAGPAPWNIAFESYSPGVDLERFRISGGSIGLWFKAVLEDVEGRRVTARDGEITGVGLGISVGGNDPVWLHEVLYGVHVTPVADGAYVDTPPP